MVMGLASALPLSQPSSSLSLNDATALMVINAAAVGSPIAIDKRTNTHERVQPPNICYYLSKRLCQLASVLQFY
ncbi:MAG: hypothetical protein M3498_08385, partial [Deinococcota bacterium]|nr:hypothetical protein [Deinococcota bacterium]